MSALTDDNLAPAPSGGVRTVAGLLEALRVSDKPLDVQRRAVARFLELPGIPALVDAVELRPELETAGLL